MKKRTKPYTAEEFARDVVSKLELPDILDYWLPKGGNKPIESYAFSFLSDLNPGGSEGIYADVGLEFSSGERMLLATFKTLDTSKEAFEKMGSLIGDFIFEANKLVNSNIDDFDWEQFSREEYDSEYLMDKQRARYS